MLVKSKISTLFLLFVLGLLFLSCKKIETPNEDARELFGEWEYLGNTGGFSGTGGSNRFPTDCWIEFTETGNFKVYEGSKKISSTRFTLHMKKSIYSDDYRPAIITKNGKFETFQIQDGKLYISDETYDGYTYYFERK